MATSTTDGFADTELASNVSPLFPLIGAAPAPERRGHVPPRAMPASAAPSVHRGFPDARASRQSLTTLLDEQRRLLEINDAAHRDGHDQGFKAGQLYERERGRLDGWFWLLAGVLLGGALVAGALHLGRHVGAHL